MQPTRFRGLAAVACSWLLFPVFLGLALQSSPAMSSPPPPGGISLEGHLNTTCIPHNGGTVYLQVQLTTGPDTRPSRGRRQMNLAVVLDRSGSMADDKKLDYAKQAICSLLDQLSGEDYLSIIIYDDQIETLLPVQRVRDRDRIKDMVREIYPRGSTNLGGGMIEGFRQIQRNFRTECVNRVILLSDGLANRGITNPSELDDIASRYGANSISLSTIGVGLEYNENLMLGLAEHGGGNYYYVESPRQLASIFEHEFSGLTSVIAQHASIEITPGRGVAIRDVIGCSWRQEGGRWIMNIGDLYSNDRREYTLEMIIPEGAGTLCAARGVLNYDCDGRPSRGNPGFSVDIHYTDDVSELRKGKDWDAQGKADLAVSTRTVEHAMKALDAGRRDEARQELNEATAVLESSGAMSLSAVAAPMIGVQLRQLKSYSDSVKDETSDLRRVKKSMQYQNYKTQRQKK
jgi:Ca-activated chloride channel family protein